MSRSACALMALVVIAGCAESGPTTPAALTGGGAAAGPSANPPKANGPVVPGTISFEGLTEEGAIASYQERGFTLRLTGTDWVAALNYGNPRPFARFQVSAGTSASGTVELSADGQLFSFASVDLYSSTTKIPYRISGLHGTTTVFTLEDTLPNTFGQFRTVAAADPDARIDTLRITLTNNAAPCCSNPMGLDSIVVR